MRNNPHGWNSGRKKKKTDREADIVLASQRACGVAYYTNNGVKLEGADDHDGEEDMYYSLPFPPLSPSLLSPPATPSSFSSSPSSSSPKTPSSIEVIELDSSDDEDSDDCYVVENVDEISPEKIAEQKRMFSYYGICSVIMCLY